ncbi:MAG: ABC transporter permease subunit [Nitriliruptorales bacterium]|nr:ABC transporter permease subunit [Nitriliruptorales bacterium]
MPPFRYPPGTRTAGVVPGRADPLRGLHRTRPRHAAHRVAAAGCDHARFFLPPGADRPGGVTRALIVFVLFASAYVAEDVRGGLQGVPKGQVEAAKALGMSPVPTTLLVVLPQALRNVLPALVSQFISLTKDTVLVAIIGLTDVVRIARAVTSQPEFVGQGLQAETLLFAAFLLWSVCFAMSRTSQRLEQRLGLGVR